MSKLILEGQVFRIAYSLVAEKEKFQKNCRTWRAKAEQIKTWTDLQDHFIEAQAYLREHQNLYRQGRGGYTSGGVHNTVGIQDAFANLKMSKKTLTDK